MALNSGSTTLKTSSKPLILHRQNGTWQEIRAIKLLPSVTARILAGLDILAFDIFHDSYNPSTAHGVASLPVMLVNYRLIATRYSSSLTQPPHLHLQTQTSIGPAFQSTSLNPPTGKLRPTSFASRILPRRNPSPEQQPSR